MPNSHNTSRVIQWATTWPGSGILWITGTVAAIVTATTIATNIGKNESDKLDTTDELDITQILPDLPIGSGSPVTPEKHAQIQAQMNEQTKSDVKAFLLDKLHEYEGSFDEPASPRQLDARARWILETLQNADQISNRMIISPGAMSVRGGWKQDNLSGERIEKYEITLGPDSFTLDRFDFVVETDYQKNSHETTAIPNSSAPFAEIAKRAPRENTSLDQKRAFITKSVKGLTYQSLVEKKDTISPLDMRGEYMNFFMQNWGDIWKACYPQEVSGLKNFTVEQTVNSIVIRVHFEDGSLAHTQSPYLRPSQLFEDVEKHIKENWDSMFSQGSFNSLPDLDPYGRIASQVAIGNDKTGRPIEISFTLRTAQEGYIHFSIRDPNTAPPIPIPLVPRS